MFSITPTALDKLEELQENESSVLLVSILGGGCAGMSYHMEWTYHETVVLGKSIYCIWLGKIIVLTDSKSALFLEDVTLDYEGGLNGKGFVWDKPSAKRVCGCGSSFST